MECIITLTSISMSGPFTLDLSQAHSGRDGSSATLELIENLSEIAEETMFNASQASSSQVTPKIRKTEPRMCVREQLTSKRLGTVKTNTSRPCS